MTDADLATWGEAFDALAVSSSANVIDDDRAAWSVWCLGRNGDVAGPVDVAYPRDWHELVAVFDATGTKVPTS